MRTVGKHVLRIAEHLFKPPNSPVPAALDELWIDPSALLNELMQRALSAELDVPPRPPKSSERPRTEAVSPEPGLPLSADEPPESLPAALRSRTSNPDMINLTPGLLRTLADLQIMPRAASPALPEFPLIDPTAPVSHNTTMHQLLAIAAQSTRSGDALALFNPTLPEVSSDTSDVVSTPVRPGSSSSSDPDLLHFPAEPSPDLLELANAAPHWTLDNPTPTHAVRAMQASPDSITSMTQYTSSRTHADSYGSPQSSSSNVGAYGNTPDTIPPSASPPVGMQRTASDISSAGAQRAVPLQETPDLVTHSYASALQPPSISRLVRGAGGLAGILRANVAEAEAPVMRQTIQPDLPDMQINSALPDSPALPELSMTPTPNGRLPQVDVNNMDIEYLMERVAEYLEYEYLRTYGTSGGR
jgi:hypothetical protein